MKGWMPAFGVVAAIALAAGVWHFTSRADAPVDRIGAVPEVRSPAATVVDSGQQPASATPAPVTIRAAPAAAAAPTVADRFNASDDYYAFAESVFLAAAGNDPSSQFYLAEAIQNCDDGYQVYFDRRDGSQRTLEEALLAVARQGPGELAFVQWLHERCHRLKNANVTPFGTAGNWLNRAIEARHPVALAREAAKIHLEVLRSRYQAGEGAPLTAENIERLARVRELLREALQSRDPQALYEAGGLSHVLFENEFSLGVRHQAWMVVACERGMDCSADTPLAHTLCRYDRNCQSGESVVDMIRRAQANEWPEIERLSRELSGQIDAGEWDKLLGG